MEYSKDNTDIEQVEGCISVHMDKFDMLALPDSRNLANCMPNIELDWNKVDQVDIDIDL